VSAEELAYLTPEARARVVIDRMLAAAGWVVQEAGRVNLSAGRGVAVREFVMRPPHGRADYLLFLDGRATGIVEAKKEGETLTGVEWQSAKYVDGLPDELEPAIEGGLPFVCESTGTETRFTNRLAPDPASRQVCSFHRPETLAGWLDEVRRHATAPTLRHRLRALPPLEHRPLACPAHRGREPRALARGEPAARADPDGDRLGQDVHRRERRLPAREARRRATDPLPRRPTKGAIGTSLVAAGSGRVRSTGASIRTMSSARD
jgi:type I restriction enzyme R subunit